MEQESIIRELQVELMRVTEDRNKWEKLYKLSWKARFDHSWSEVEKFYSQTFGKQ